MKSLFEKYKARSAEKRKEIEILINALNIDFKDKTILELGPGYGDFIDIAIERGAKKVFFIERDQDFFDHNNKKVKVIGYFRNYLKHCSNKLFIAIISGLFVFDKIDLLYSKGGFSMDQISGGNL